MDDSVRLLLGFVARIGDYRVVAHGAIKPMTIGLMGSSEDYLIHEGGKWLIGGRRVAPWPIHKIKILKPSVSRRRMFYG